MPTYTTFAEVFRNQSVKLKVFVFFFSGHMISQFDIGRARGRVLPVTPVARASHAEDRRS